MATRTTVVCTALVMAGLAACMGRSASLTPQVSEYIQPLPKSESPLDGTPRGVLQYFARKDTLKVNGNIIVANWNFGSPDDVCANHPGTMALILSNIDHFDDLTPCPGGSVLVRAVLK
jgi:hypothetical protein